MGVRATDVLWVHAGLQTALQMAGDSPAAKVDTILDALDDAVPEGILVVPTFTYSFTREESYDVEASPSTVGVLGERFRHRDGVRRTTDPVFSAALRGTLPPAWERRLFEVHDVECFGERSIFSYLREVDAKLLFIGVGFEYCTQVHYLEQRMRVPYRYLKDFTGTVRMGGRTAPVNARYYARDLEGDVVNHFGPLGEALLASGGMISATLPRGPSLLLTSAAAVEDEATRRLRANPDFLLRKGHTVTAGP